MGIGYLKPEKEMSPDDESRWLVNR